MINPRSDPALLHDILRKIELVESTTKQRDRSDMVVERAAERSLEIIGEAAGHLSVELKTRYPQVPWREMKDMRNLLIHHYFGVDISRLWKVVDDELPKLKNHLQTIVKEMT